jgi:hypothetical protein
MESVRFIEERGCFRFTVRRDHFWLEHTVGLFFREHCIFLPLLRFSFEVFGVPFGRSFILLFLSI